MARTTISSLFGRSPIHPLQTHMASVQECVSALRSFIQVVIDEDWAEVKAQQKIIAKLEGDADKLKKDLRLHLPKSLFMPISRRDLLEVLTMQDMIANKAKDIAGLIVGRKIIIPAEITEAFIEFIDRSIDASEQAQVAINELDELVETGFRGNEVKLVQSMIKKLNKIEKDTDKIQVKIRTSIFKIEKEMDPVEVIFLYKVVEWVGDLGDYAQRVGSRLELMLAR